MKYIYSFFLFSVVLISSFSINASGPMKIPYTSDFGCNCAGLIACQSSACGLDFHWLC
jgi:hypothetical protein